MGSESDLETVNFSDVEVEVLGNEAADAPLDDPIKEAEQTEEGGPSLPTSPQTPTRTSMAARMAASRESRMKKVKSTAMEAKRREEERRKEDDDRRRALEVNAKRAQNARKVAKKKTHVPMPSDAIVVDESDDEVDAEFARGAQALEAKGTVGESPMRKTKKKDIVSDDDDGKKEMESHELQKSRSNVARKGMKRSAAKRKKGVKTPTAEVNGIENEDLVSRGETARELADDGSRDGFDFRQDGESPVLSQKNGRSDSLRSRIANPPSGKTLSGAAKASFEKKKRREEEMRVLRQNAESTKDVEEEAASSVPMNQEQLHSHSEEKAQLLSSVNGTHKSGGEEDDESEDGEKTEAIATKDSEADQKREAELKKQRVRDERKRKAEERRKQREAEVLRKKENTARLKAMQADKRDRSEEERRGKGSTTPNVNDDDALLAPRSGRSKRPVGEVVNTGEEDQIITAAPDAEPNSATASLIKRKRGRPRKSETTGEELAKKRRVGVVGNDRLNTQKEVSRRPNSSRPLHTGENPAVNVVMDVPSGDAGTPQETGKRKEVSDQRSNDVTPTFAERLSVGLQATESTAPAVTQEQSNRVGSDGQGDEKTNASLTGASAMNERTTPAEATGKRGQSEKADPERFISANTEDGHEYEAMTGAAMPPQSELHRAQVDKMSEPVSNQMRARVSDEDFRATVGDNAIGYQHNAEPTLEDLQSHEKPASTPLPESRNLHLYQMVSEKDELVIVRNLLDELQTDDLEHVELQGERIDKTITKLTQRSKAARPKSLANVRRGGMSEVKQFLRRRKLADDIEVAKLALRTAQQQALVAFAEAISASLRTAHENGGGALSDMIGMKMGIHDEVFDKAVEQSGNKLQSKFNPEAHGGERGATNASKRNNGAPAGKGAVSVVGFGSTVNLDPKEISSKDTARGNFQRRTEIEEKAAALAHSIVGAAKRTSQQLNADKGVSEVNDTTKLPVLKTMQAVKSYIGTKYSSLNLDCPRSEAILIMCERRGGVQLEELYEALPFSKRVIEAKLADLQKKGFISGSYINRANESFRVFSTVGVADSS